MFDYLLSEEVLPMLFVGLMGLAILVYAILDGYDLGVGILLPMNSDSEHQRDIVISSIGPFWDANETWLVLAIGLLLIAFPEAHSIVLRELYIPALFLLAGLILRGVAFDFRTKAISRQKKTWDASFKLGSIIASMSQGYMLGQYVLGFDQSLPALLFSFASAFCVAAAYAFIGAGWLVMKTEGEVQVRAARWGRRAAWIAAGGILAVSIINPLIDRAIFAKWVGFPESLLLLPIPLLCGYFFLRADRYFAAVPHPGDRASATPFLAALCVFVLCFCSLAYSYFPYVIPHQVTVWEAASANSSLTLIFIGAVIVVPCIIAYTALSYWIFRGKTTELTYY